MRGAFRGDGSAEPTGGVVRSRRAGLVVALVVVAIVAVACSSSSGGSGAVPGSTGAPTTAATRGGPAASPAVTGAPPVRPFDAASAFPADSPLIVATPRGTVRGDAEGGVRRFQSIPYAAAPVGDLRWRGPQPAPSWSGVRAATEASPSCPQVLPVVDAEVGQEDCLYLNVFTPEQPADSLAPVMVWIHGGGFTVGSSTDDVPDRIAARGGVVTVSINYRLGPFGFLADPDLAAADPDHALGTMGIQDQQAALRWVQESIAAFGGDPSNVTIFGESAGGMSVCAHLYSPASAGLFHRAILQSGPCTTAGIDRAVSVPQAAELSRILGCDGATERVACLRSRDAKAVLEALPGDPTFLFRKAAFWLPTADDVVLPSDLAAARAAGRTNRVPVLAGTTRDEGRLFMGMAAHTIGSQVPRVTPAQYGARLRQYFGDEVGAKVEAQYPLSAFPGPDEAFGQAIGDATLACPAIEGAVAVADDGPLHLYRFDRAPGPFVLPMDGIDLGAFHSAELPYVFGGTVQSSGAITLTGDDRALSDTMIEAWTRFARTGDPAGPGLAWPVAGPQRTTLVLDVPQPRVEEDPSGEVCRFWVATGWNAADANRS